MRVGVMNIKFYCFAQFYRSIPEKYFQFLEIITGFKLILFYRSVYYLVSVLSSQLQKMYNKIKAQDKL